MSSACENTGGKKALVAGEQLYAYRRLKLNSSNQAVLAGAGEDWIGTAEDDTASGSNVTVRVRTFPGTRRMVASAAITAGAAVYGSASGKISSTASGSRVGTALQAASADLSEIEILTQFMPELPGLFGSSVAASTALTNSTVATKFDQAVSIPANTLKAGDVIRITYQGIATSTNSTDTLGIKAFVGTVEVQANTAVDVANNDIFAGYVDVTIRTIGASGTCVAAGAGTIGATATGTMKGTFKASQTIDTTGALSVAIEGTWSVASASNSCRLDLLNVQILRTA